MDTNGSEANPTPSQEVGDSNAAKKKRKQTSKVWNFCLNYGCCVFVWLLEILSLYLYLTAGNTVAVSFGCTMFYLDFYCLINL